MNTNAQRSTETHRRERDDLRSNYWRRKVVPEVKRLYGTICHICDKPIDMGLKSPHPQSFSVDHIRGAATGFDLRYLRPAHLGCNLKQGDPTRGDPTPKVMTRW